MIVSDDHLIQSAIRNFGGHAEAQKVVLKCLSRRLELQHVNSIPVLDMIVQNIKDSSQELSVHIARHLMVLNRSLIGLQLLNRYVKPKLGNGLAWHVLFGSCFPGDLQVFSFPLNFFSFEKDSSNLLLGHGRDKETSSG